MQWLNKLVDEIVAKNPQGEVLVQSGGSPSGTYHLGHLRELVTADAIMRELQRRGRKARHIYFSDDLDALRKVPVNVPAEYDKYLGQSLCDIPAPDGKSDTTYGQYFLNGLKTASRALGLEIDFIDSHTKYRSGFFEPAIEAALKHTEDIKEVLETVSGHKLGQEWSPIQVNEGGYLKKRQFVAIDTVEKTVSYLDKDGTEQTVSYKKGEVKLDWRIDWPARWWLLKVDVEPFGRDHATKGGSYDTGAELIKKVFESSAPLPVPYDFVNLTGDTKKMSASKGTGLDAAGVVKVMPPEIIRYFLLRYPPSKRLYFDPEQDVAQLIDEFAELQEKEPDSKLLLACREGLDPIISRVPFTHLVSSYQAALKNPDATIDILSRTGYEHFVKQNRQILIDELKYIDQWLKQWAPEEVKFDLAPDIDLSMFSDAQKDFLNNLAEKIGDAPKDADGEWFHKTIYELQSASDLSTKETFNAIYMLLINKSSGPRAGWFLSILPKDWLIKRLRLEE